MNKRIKIIALISLVLGLGTWAAAQTASAPTAKDPVCGMSVRVEGAKFTAEYGGKTYYFCSAGCKTEFLKNPAGYAGEKTAEAPNAQAAAAGCAEECAEACEKKAEAAPQAAEAAGCPAMKAAAESKMPGCPMMMKPGCACCGRKMMHGRHGRMGMLAGEHAGCGQFMDEKTHISVENTADGIVVKITSKDPETVKMIQKHAAACKAEPASAAGEGSCCKKAETCKEKK
jgi:YHS domain-containing protein